MKQQGLCEHLWRLRGRGFGDALALGGRIDLECELCGLGRCPEAGEIFEKERAWCGIVKQMEVVDHEDLR